MGAEEETIPSKPSNVTTSTQEAPTTPSYPDWSSSMQAYYGTGVAPPYFASTVASATPHPYMWGGQHPFMPPYGTPIPYPALYPAGGVYAHLNMAMTPNAAQGNSESEGKTTDVKHRTCKKKSKENSGLDSGKDGENGKAASGSGNDGASESAESGSDDSLDANDENNNQQELARSKQGGFNQMLADGANAQNNAVSPSAHATLPGKPVVSVPGTNLNIGMDIWNASPAAAVNADPNSGVSPAVTPVALIGRKGLLPDHQWIQDERELKRQKRKESNRESARRSRLRKQAECEDLQRRVEALNGENHSLREELERLSEECGKLTSENESMKEELTRLCGDAMATLENKDLSPGPGPGPGPSPSPSPDVHSEGGEGTE